MVLNSDYRLELPMVLNHSQAQIQTNNNSESLGDETTLVILRNSPTDSKEQQRLRTNVTVQTNQEVSGLYLRLRIASPSFK